MGSVLFRGHFGLIKHIENAPNISFIEGLIESGDVVQTEIDVGNFNIVREFKYNEG